MWEKTLERPWDSKIKLGNCKGNQHWIFTEQTDAKTPIPWPPFEKSQIIGKDLDAGKDWRQKEMGMTEDELVGWHHQLDGQELSKLQELVMDWAAWCAVVHEVTNSRRWLSDWTELKGTKILHAVQCGQKKKKKISTFTEGSVIRIRKKKKTKPKSNNWKQACHYCIGRPGIRVSEHQQRLPW